jgi:hypothetical protein
MALTMAVASVGRHRRRSPPLWVGQAVILARWLAASRRAALWREELMTVNFIIGSNLGSGEKKAAQIAGSDTATKMVVVVMA